MSALSRRQVFLSGAAVVGAATLPAALADAHPDAELVSLYLEFYRNYDAMTGENDQEVCDALHDAYWAAVEKMYDIEAISLIGLCAKAQIIQEAGGDGGGVYEELTLSLAQDCLRLGREAHAVIRSLPNGVQS